VEAVDAGCKVSAVISSSALALIPKKKTKLSTDFYQDTKPPSVMPGKLFLLRKVGERKSDG
jgi:hypothetical protein